MEEAPAPYTVSGAPAPVHVMVAEPDAVAGVEDDVALDEVAAKRKSNLLRWTCFKLLKTLC